MSGSVLVDRGRHLWAKSAEQAPGHSLLAHMLDVGLVALELLERRPDPLVGTLGSELGLSEGDALNACVVLAALHDIGKATPVFQAKWPAGAPAEATTTRTRVDIPHGRATAALLRDVLREAGYSRASSGLANAVAIHHGMRMTSVAMDAGRIDPRSLGTGTWERWRSALVEDVQVALGALPSPSRKALLSGRSWALLAGLTSVADWIGSSLPFVGLVEDPVQYTRDRRDRVRARLREIGWPEGRRWTAREREAPFASWFFDGTAAFSPRPLQAAVERIAPGARPPFLLVIEAPMGEGKTEAALFAAGCNADLGMYIGLPTQATSDAIHARLETFVRRHEAGRTNVALAHAAAAETRRLRSHPSFDDESLESEGDAEDWFGSAKRALLAQVGAGTVDQALRAVLPVRHFFVRLWGLSHKVVVLDEVHAYEAYTSALIEELLTWLGAVGAPAVVMTATLPRATKRELKEAYCRGAGLTAPSDDEVAYPRLTVVGAESSESVAFEGTRRSQVEVLPVPYDLAGLGTAAAGAAGSGAAVAVIVNTVERAQRLYSRCKELRVAPLLVHARFPLEERKRREDEVVRRFGPGASPGDRHGIVIATQVLEQSLDVDFDVLFSDLAPVDLVLQRVGRLHRHAGRTRPESAAQPRVFVAGLDVGDGSAPDPEALESVYDRWVMWRSWALLQGRRLIDLPGDIDALVQLAYSDEPLEALAQHEEAVEEARRELEASRTAQRLAAQNWSLASPLDPASQSWGEAGVDADEERAYALKLPTRLGEDSVAAVPVNMRQNSWTVFGTEAITRLPAHRAAEDFVTACLRRQVKVTNKRLVARLRDAKRPCWWRRSGPLRHMYPLPLDAQGVFVGDERVRLDQTLGLVIERGKEM